MSLSSKVQAGVRVGWAWLAAPEPWSPRQTAPGVPGGRGRGLGGELALALALALLVAGIEELISGKGLLVAGSGVGAGLLSLLRRRLPITVLVVTSGLSVVLGGFILLEIVVSWSAGRRIAGARRALGAFTGAYLVFAAVVLLTSWSDPSAMTRMMLLLLTLTFLASAVIPGLASRYSKQRRTLLHALQERNAQLMWERQMVVGQARLMERQRIAQDMHDSLGHQLALIAVHTGALEVDPELTGRQREAVGVLRNASVSAMHELREVVGILRDGVEAPSAPVDESGRAARGTAGIEGLVTAARAAGNTVELRREGVARPLAAAADHAAYRIVQEALTNAFKHAPGAPIEVELRYEPDSLVVEIVSGAAAAAAAGEVVSGGQGLTGLRERARLVGGMVHTGPVGGGGFRVAGVLPYGTGEAAPVAAADDGMGAQPVRPPYQDGLPVMDWSVSGRPMTAAEWGASGVSGRTGGVGLGCGVVVGAVVLLIAIIVGGLFLLLSTMDQGMIDRAEYDQVEVGEGERAVRDKLPSGDTIATTGLSGKGPRTPEGASCLVLMSSEMSEDFDTEPVFRFCFRDGELVEKRAYDVRR